MRPDSVDIADPHAWRLDGPVNIAKDCDSLSNDVTSHAPTAMWIATISIGKYDFYENPSVFSFIWRCSSCVTKERGDRLVLLSALPYESFCDGARDGGIIHRSNSQYDIGSVLEISLKWITHHHHLPLALLIGHGIV